MTADRAVTRRAPERRWSRRELQNGVDLCLFFEARHYGGFERQRPAFLRPDVQEVRLPSDSRTRPTVAGE
jgi:hypothetical protein